MLSGGGTKSLVQSVGGGLHKTSAALSPEDWDKLEESAERIQKSIVGSLKTILHEVQDVLGNPSLASAGGGGVTIGGGARSEEDEAQRDRASRGGEDTVQAFRALAQQRKADYEDFIACMRQSSAFDLRAKVQRFCKALLEGKRFERQDTADMVQQAMGEFEAILLQHPLWSSRSEEAQERSLDALEHYIMMRLHKRIFAVPQAATPPPRHRRA
jgi:hypothetical protein